MHPGRVISLTEAIDWLHAHTRQRPPEIVPLHQATGRVLAAAIPLAAAPAHDAAAIDGLAIRAADSEGAGEYAPISIQATSVAAGTPMPAGTDAVLPPHAYENGTVFVPIARGANVHPRGHDVAEGTILPAGLRLTPLHLALLPADPLVHSQPRVAVNSPLGEALLAGTGAMKSVEDPDLVLLPRPLDKGGDDGPTSMRDPTQPLLQAIPVRLHGDIPVILLPRRPADAATLFALLVAPILRRRAGLPEPAPMCAVLARKITSSLGQQDAIRVRVANGEATPLGPAEGIGLLAATAATGLVLIPEDSEGYPAGALVPICPV